MAKPLEATRLLFDLRRANQILQQVTGCLDPELIAQSVTQALVQDFECAFARIWVVDPDGAVLRLIASAGLYTRLDGSFARVPMGAFKVGKIAQNRICFFSNNLPEEPWVKDRSWALEHQLLGFAGYPLATPDKVIGVLAVFSHEPMASEFFEVLMSFCTALTALLDLALQLQRSPTELAPSQALSDQMAQLLNSTPLTLTGTERPLTLSLNQALLRTTEILSTLKCGACHLNYGQDTVSLEAMIASRDLSGATPTDTHPSLLSVFGNLSHAAACLGGELHTEVGGDAQVIQVVLTLPYLTTKGPKLQIHCRQSVLQLAFTQLAHLAGISVCPFLKVSQHPIPLLTDDPTLVSYSERILWIQQAAQMPPLGVKAYVTLTLTPAELLEATETVLQDQAWRLQAPLTAVSISERERDIMKLLAQGLRDRDVAAQLHISESTVKFHVNNVVTKLQVRTRLQALYQLTRQGVLA